MVTREVFTRRRTLPVLFGALFARTLSSQSSTGVANAALALWRDVREGLTSSDSSQYWEALKEAFIPGGVHGATRFTGKLVSVSPETNPTVLMIAVDGPSADARVELIEALTGSMPPGSEIQFAGTATDFTKSPYVLTLESDTVDIEGWKGK